MLFRSDLVADFRASTPTDAAKKVVPDVTEELKRISDLRDRADRRINELVVLEMTKIVALMQRPVMADPVSMITNRFDEISALRNRTLVSMNSRLIRAYDEVAHIAARVRTLSPQATLDRGYAVVQKLDGTILRSPKALTPGEVLKLRLAEGVALATASDQNQKSESE